MGCLFLGGGGVGGMFPFVALARISMLRNMMFLAREHIFTATQHDVSYNYLRAFVHQGNTEEKNLLMTMTS